MTTIRDGTDEQDLEREFREFVGNASFPCLAGKGVVRSGGCRVRVYESLGSPGASTELAVNLREFAKGLDDASTGLQSFVAVFSHTVQMNEQEFESRVWQQLQQLHELDARDASWDPTVSSDPADPNFSFSVATHAFFVVGMHPNSSRLSRRFGWPALIFNPHAQFELLRADGRFEPLQAAIRLRDIALQGNLNPNLAAFSEESEARQYSGRATEPDWKCPFHRKTP